MLLKNQLWKLGLVSVVLRVTAQEHATELPDPELEPEVMGNTHELESQVVEKTHQLKSEVVGKTHELESKAVGNAHELEGVRYCEVSLGERHCHGMDELSSDVFELCMAMGNSSSGAGDEAGEVPTRMCSNLQSWETEVSKIANAPLPECTLKGHRMSCGQSMQCHGGSHTHLVISKKIVTATYDCTVCQGNSLLACCKMCKSLHPLTSLSVDRIHCHGCDAETQERVMRGGCETLEDGSFHCMYADACELGAVQPEEEKSSTECRIWPCDSCGPMLMAHCCQECLTRACKHGEPLYCQGCNKASSNLGVMAAMGAFSLIALLVSALLGWWWCRSSRADCGDPHRYLSVSTMDDRGNG